MDFGSGGYVIVDLAKGTPITVGIDSPTVIDVSPEDAAKLRQWEKPVMFAPLLLTKNGVVPECFTGFSIHYGNGLGGGKHLCGEWQLQASAENKVTITYKALDA